ncbi:MAG: hypothetical protein GX446_14735 [Chthonomonadales bacterium]|nr:hypothetical protein [Chthonomonadales bacterium]
MRSVFTWVVAVGVMVMIAGSASVARADSDETGLTVSAKLGVFYPVHGTMRSQTAREWWYVGVDLDPGFRYKPANGTVHFGVDFDYRDAQGRGVFTIPLLAKVTWPITTSEEEPRLYGGLGPGAYFINSRYSGAVLRPGMQFVAGVNLGDRAFVEAAYDWVGAFYDDAGTPVRADALKFAIGIRF